MIITYLDQLDEAAKKAGLDLVDVCKHEGIAITTLQRWRRGDVSPREGTARALLARIVAMGKKRA